MIRSVRFVPVLFGAVAVLLSAPNAAQAQTVECDSQNNRYRYCAANVTGSVELVRQASDDPCIEGRTWGYDARGIWVDRGCRASFRLVSGWAGSTRGSRVDCASDNGRYHECFIYTGGNVSIVRRISDSACIEGETWGFDDEHIWVDRGCRAEFQVHGRASYNESHMSTWHTDDGQMVRCESRNGTYARCRMDITGRVTMQRQLSQDACQENRTWGTDDYGVWVTDGCRAEFVVSRSGRNPYRSYSGSVPTSHSRTVRCESLFDLRRTCIVGRASVTQVTIVNRLSESPCIEGDTWGWNGSIIWVSRGCRAEFRVRE